MNPQGCRVQSFKTPTSLEQSHDFLWRVHPVVPRRGEVVIFNRSYYEAVLIERVHKFATPEQLEYRYKAINQFEELLEHNGTRIVKFFLHIDKEEQLRRFVRRLKRPEKHWKISANDYPERQYWDDYVEAFEVAMMKCSTKEAPWFAIPANCKWFRNLAVSQIILETMESMQIRLPGAVGRSAGDAPAGRHRALPPAPRAEEPQAGGEKVTDAVRKFPRVRFPGKNCAFGGGG